MSARLLPPNASELQRALADATVRTTELPVPIRDLVDPDRCPLHLLPYLAWSLSIDAWSSEWPEVVKRSRVRRAIEIQRQKGTATSVRSVVESFGGAVALREWWQLDPPGDPHTFELVVTITGVGGAPATAAFAEAVIAEVRRTKPVRSHFTFTQGLTAVGGLKPITTARPALFRRLTLAAPAAA